MQNILIIGASGHAKVVADIVEKEQRFNIVGLLENTFQGRGSKSFGYEIIGRETDLPELAEKLDVSGVIVAIGDNWKRSEVVKRLIAETPQLNFVSTVHPCSQIGRDVDIGRGTAVMAGAVINSATKIGEFCIINTNSSIDHDCFIDDYASVAPGAVLGGNVKIGRYSAISIGAGVIQKVTIGEHTVVGAGSTILKDVPGHVVCYGTPAKVIRKRNAGDAYL